MTFHVDAILLLFHFRWFANGAALEAMDQSLPPRPALLLRLMLILKPSRFRQLLSNLWVTHPTLHPLTVLNGRSIPVRFGDTNAARQASMTKHGQRTFPAQLYAGGRRNARAFGVSVEISDYINHHMSSIFWIRTQSQSTLPNTN